MKTEIIVTLFRNGAIELIFRHILDIVYCPGSYFCKHAFDCSFASDPCFKFNAFGAATHKTYFERQYIVTGRHVYRNGNQPVIVYINFIRDHTGRVSVDSPELPLAVIAVDIYSRIILDLRTVFTKVMGKRNLY